MRRLRRRTIVIQVVSLLIAFVLGCALLLAKVDADAAPKAPSASAGSAAGAAAAVATADAAPGDAGADDAQAAIDLAIAPDGGVPFHPSGTPFRSPFARPNAGAALTV